MSMRAHVQSLSPARCVTSPRFVEACIELRDTLCALLCRSLARSAEQQAASSAVPSGQA